MNPLIPSKYFDTYQNQIGSQLEVLISEYDFTETKADLGYRTEASAVYSSNIEGNTIDLNSFMNYKLSQKKFKATKEIEEIENLVLAYKLAQSSRLNEDNLLSCHNILSKTLLPKNQQGKYRKEKVGVFGKSGLVYLAVESELVKETMATFFNEIIELLNADLRVPETFYYAAMIHLRFAHIHPFRDGNGRSARLLEKWFLAEKLNKNIWKILSEKYYKDHQTDYYNNLNLGVNYYELDYDLCMPFLKMLPESLKSID